MKFYSQQGEDILIFLKYINQVVNDGIYVELGAVDGVTYSNTKFFEDYLGFKGILIEPQQYMFNILQSNRPNNILINKAITNNTEPVEFIGNTPTGGIKSTMSDTFINGWHKNSSSYLVETSKLTNIFNQNNIKYIDFFSLDVEGGEYQVLKTIDFSQIEMYLICIELDGHNKEKDEQCREILRNNGFEFKEKLQINEYWINPNYSRKHLLYKHKTTTFTGINQFKHSNLGHHVFIENHLINSISNYLIQTNNQIKTT